MNKQLSPNSQRIIEAYGVLDWAGNDSTITIKDSSGQEQSFKCTSDILDALKTGVSALALKRTEQVQQSLRTTSDEAAQAFDLEPATFNNLVSKEGSSSDLQGRQIGPDDFMPALYQSTHGSQGQERRVT